MEIWKEVKGINIYEVSNLGRIRHKKRKRIKSVIIDSWGYCRVWLYWQGKSPNKKVHRLVAEAFIRNPKNKRTVNHKNGIKTDNRSQNLEWATDAENIKHAIDNGLFHDGSHLRGENANTAKLKDKDVRYIRSIPKDKLDKPFLMNKYGIVESTLNRCLSGKYWKHIK